MLNISAQGIGGGNIVYLQERGEIPLITYPRQTMPLMELNLAFIENLVYGRERITLAQATFVASSSSAFVSITSGKIASSPIQSS